MYLEAEDTLQRQLQRIVAVHFEAEAGAVEAVAVMGTHRRMQLAIVDDGPTQSPIGQVRSG